MTTTPRTATTPSRKARTRYRGLQTMLRTRAHEIQNSLRHRARPVLADRRGGGLDESELTEADVQDHIAVALIQMKGETLERIREALARLAQGKYGDCVECAGEISEQRLRALPFAVRCTACEALRERGAAREQRSTSITVFRSVFPDPIGS